MKLMIAAAALTAQPQATHPSCEHLPIAQVPTADTKEAAVRTVLSQFRAAIERLDASGTERLFAPDSTIFETGRVEGSYANYLAHHLGPELAAFKSFHHSNYRVQIHFEGPLALATETYTYRIETMKGQLAERHGVASSILKTIGGEWKILLMHNSARIPKGS